MSYWVIHDMRRSITTLGPEGKAETNLYVLKEENLLQELGTNVLERARGIRGNRWLYPELSNYRKHCCLWGWRSKGCWFLGPIGVGCCGRCYCRVNSTASGADLGWAPGRCCFGTITDALPSHAGCARACCYPCPITCLCHRDHQSQKQMASPSIGPFVVRMKPGPIWPGSLENIVEFLASCNAEESTERWGWLWVPPESTQRIWSSSVLALFEANQSLSPSLSLFSPLSRNYLKEASVDWNHSDHAWFFSIRFALVVSLHLYNWGT